MDFSNRDYSHKISVQQNINVKSQIIKFTFGNISSYIA